MPVVDDDTVAALVVRAGVLAAKLLEVRAERRAVVGELRRLVGAAEAGRLLGVSRQAIYQLSG